MRCCRTAARGGDGGSGNGLLPSAFAAGIGVYAAALARDLALRLDEPRLGRLLRREGLLVALAVLIKIIGHPGAPRLARVLVAVAHARELTEVRGEYSPPSGAAAAAAAV
jgi:hypothetical protein